MSTTIESVGINSSPEMPGNAVDQLLESVWDLQSKAEIERFLRLERLHAIGSLPSRHATEVTDVAQPMRFGDVLPSFVAPRQDKYRHVAFREEHSALLTHEAWRIHTEGYVSSGFVKENAVDPITGYLAADIDKSRGSTVDYHVAYNPDKPHDRATLRIGNVSDGGTYEELPAYQLCKDGLTEEGLDLFKNMANQDKRLKEIACMAKTASGHPMGVHEILRKVSQHALGNDEVWLFTIVSNTFDSLVKTFGETNFKVIGDSIAIPDSRVNPDVRLIPAVLYPDLLHDRILDAYKLADDPRDQLRLMRTLVFMTEGLHKNQMSPEVFETRRTVLEKAHSQALATKRN